MTLAEILEASSVGGVQPLTPKQARARATRIEKARAAAADIRAANAARQLAANRKIAMTQQIT